jgi:hypothetical protein
MLPEPVEVLVVAPLGDVVKLTGAGQKTGQVHQRVLREDQIALLEATPETEPFDGNPLHFKLGVEAVRLGLAYEYDPYFSLSIARVDPFQARVFALERGSQFLDLRPVEVGQTRVQERKRLVGRRQLRHERFLPFLQAVVARLQFGARVAIRGQDIIRISPKRCASDSTTGSQRASRPPDMKGRYRPCTHRLLAAGVH